MELGDLTHETLDNVLVERAKAGNGDSFTELCRRYYPAMVAIAHAIVGDRYLAEDAAQQAFAKAAMNLHRLREAGQFGSWLAAICRNAARDVVRANRRLPDRHEPVDEAVEPQQDDAGPVGGETAMAPSPAHIVSMISLRTTYRQGGEEALYEQLDAAMRTSGPRPDVSSAPLLFGRL